MTTPGILTLTDRAAERIKVLLEGRGKPSLGIRIAIKTKGCSGLSYQLQFADEAGAHDERIESHDLVVLIEPKAIMFLMGTEMDFVEEELSNGFTFKNPNEKGRCGCGESFHV